MKILQNLQENICARPAKSLKKQGLAQVFYCEFCKTFKNTFPTEHLLESAIEARKKKKKLFEALTPVLIKTLRLTEIWVYVCKYRLFSVKTFTHLKLFKKIHRKNLSQNLFFNGYVGQEPMQSLRNIFSRYNKF